MEPELPDLPPPDTAGLAYSGRSVDYISGYEAGFERAADQMRQCYRMGVEAERERAATLVADLATLMEWGAGDPIPGGRLRQAERNIRDPDKQPMGVGKFAIRDTDPT